VRGRSQQVIGRCGGEVRGQQQHRRQVQPAIAQRREDGGELPGGAGDSDPPEGRLLRHVELAHAVLEHGVVRRLAVQLSMVHLCEIGQQRGRRGVMLRQMGGEIAKQGLIGEVGP